MGPTCQCLIFPFLPLFPLRRTTIFILRTFTDYRSARQRSSGPMKRLNLATSMWLLSLVVSIWGTKGRGANQEHRSCGLSGGTKRPLGGREVSVRRPWSGLRRVEADGGRRRVEQRATDGRGEKIGRPGPHMEFGGLPRDPVCRL